MSSFPWLSILTALPVIGALLILLAGNRDQRVARILAIASSLTTLAVTLLLWHRFNSNDIGMQFEEQHAWVPSLHVYYHLGCDGLGLLMLLLSAIVTVISVLASWKIESRASLYYAFVLLLETCLFGAFTALNFVHWFTYWELSLIPAFFLIKIWGGPKRTPAATQFLVYTMVGSVAMLLSFIAMYLATDTFDFVELAQLSQHGLLMPAVTASGWAHALSQHAGMVLFLGAFLGFAVKVPMVPFHTWLPAAYSEAPTGTTILLTGAMSKMGLYGFLRVLLPIFAPQMQAMLTPLLWLTVATVVLSAYSALQQQDLKRIFAYSSINHLGYCLLGILAVARYTGTDTNLLIQKYAAASGTLLQMFNHGLTAAAIFAFVAILESRSKGPRGVGDFGGLRKIAPVMTGLMGVALFSSLGLPGLNGFIGEFLIFKGAFPLVTWATSLCVIGLLVTAIFILGILQRVFAGPLNERWSGFRDLSGTEKLLLAPAIALMFLVGLYPQIILGTINTTVIQIVQRIQP
jgi:NADH-quinone oxidoreductase subunit M